MAHKQRRVETRMVSEYLLANYANFPTRTGVPLGVVDESLMATYGYQNAIMRARPYRPEVDAIIFLPNYLILLEAKVWNVVNGCAKLPLYKSLVPATPELRQWKSQEIIMELVVGWSNPNLEIMARDAGVRLKVFCPEWLTEVVEGMHKYWTREYRNERERKRAMRESLGLD